MKKKSAIEMFKKKIVYKFIPGLNISEIPIKSKIGKFYYPYYSSLGLQEADEFEIFNNDGEKMRTFFYRDYISAHSPCGNSKHFIWDRFNWGLNTHFYSHNAMLEQMGVPNKKYGILAESRAIVPNDYNIFKNNPGLENEFDKIFTYDEELLNSHGNAYFVPFCSSFWYGRNGGGELDETLYQRKCKGISIVSSNKTSCDLHKQRIAVARKCKSLTNVDTFGTFDGGSLIPIENSLQDYRYSIIIENYISSYFFTEKITNCFASQTVPIYFGATKINEFFNMDGIIQISIKDLDNIETILKQCNRQEYIGRISAIMDNYNRVMTFKNSNDYMYEHYL